MTKEGVRKRGVWEGRERGEGVRDGRRGKEESSGWERGRVGEEKEEREKKDGRRGRGRSVFVIIADSDTMALRHARQARGSPGYHVSQLSNLLSIHSLRDS